MKVAKSEKDKAAVQALIHSLRDEHESPGMRASMLTVGTTHLFATRPIILKSGDEYRITWQYGERDGEEVTLCHTLAVIG